MTSSAPAGLELIVRLTLFLSVVLLTTRIFRREVAGPDCNGTRHCPARSAGAADLDRLRLIVALACAPRQSRAVLQGPKERCPEALPVRRFENRRSSDRAYPSLSNAIRIEAMPPSGPSPRVDPNPVEHVECLSTRTGESSNPAASKSTTAPASHGLEGLGCSLRCGVSLVFARIGGGPRLIAAASRSNHRPSIGVSGSLELENWRAATRARSPGATCLRPTLSPRR